MSEPLIYLQMSKVAGALAAIPKQSASGVNYQFRSVDAVMNALHGPLTEHQVFYVPRVLDDWQLNLIPGSNDKDGNPRQQVQAVFRVEVEFYAQDGSSVVARGLAQSHDYGDKAVYQAAQNAIKYLLLQAFCIPVGEEDMDARQPDPVGPGPARIAVGLICPTCAGPVIVNSYRNGDTRKPSHVCKNRDCKNDKGFRSGLWDDKQATAEQTLADAFNNGAPLPEEPPLDVPF